ECEQRGHQRKSVHSPSPEAMSERCSSPAALERSLSYDGTRRHPKFRNERANVRLSLTRRRGDDQKSILIVSSSPCLSGGLSFFVLRGPSTGEAASTFGSATSFACTVCEASANTSLTYGLGRYPALRNSRCTMVFFGASYLKGVTPCFLPPVQIVSTSVPLGSDQTKRVTCFVASTGFLL